MTDALWTLAELTTALGVAPSLPISQNVTGIGFDSRSITNGELFVALKGATNDGHDWLADAHAKGAVAAIVSHIPPELTNSLPCFIVPDTLKALEALGRAARARSHARIVAVTGSVGKTTSKEMLKTLLSQQGNTHAAAASFNNHIGVPLTLAQMPADCDYAVFELGMNHAHELDALSAMVQPHVALITTVAAVHLGNFANEQGIAAAKAEIFAGCVPDGIGILNADNPHYVFLCAEAARYGVARLQSFGSRPDADNQLLSLTLHPDSSDITARIGKHTYRFTLPLAGAHMAMNAVAVLSAIAALGGDVEQACLDMTRLQAVSGRGTRTTLNLPHACITLLDESYNASPIAVKAALAVLALIPVDTITAGRKIAVLGDMLELGSDSERLHVELADDILKNAIDSVFCCGTHMHSLYQSLPAEKRGGYAIDSTGLAPILRENLRNGDIVLVKGSLGSRMKTIITALHNAEQAHEHTPAHPHSGKVA